MSGMKGLSDSIQQLLSGEKLMQATDPPLVGAGYSHPHVYFSRIALIRSTARIFSMHVRLFIRLGSQLKFEYDPRGSLVFLEYTPRSLAAFDIANRSKVIFITKLRASLMVENGDGDGRVHNAGNEPGGLRLTLRQSTSTTRFEVGCETTAVERIDL
jgi:hypothetical protein